MIIWTKGANGKFTRAGELEPGDVHIERQDPYSLEWSNNYGARYARNAAIEIIESGIAKGQAPCPAYRIVAAPARPISEATRARLDALHQARRTGAVDDMAKGKGKTKKTPKAKKPAREKKATTEKVAKVKGEGRKPALAPFIDGPMEIFATHKGDKVTADVDAAGIITLEGKQYTSLSAAGKAVCGKEVNGWSFWRYEKAGKETPLDDLRGSKSPLSKKEAA